MQQLVNKKLDAIKMHGTIVKNNTELTERASYVSPSNHFKILYAILFYTYFNHLVLWDGKSILASLRDL